MLDVLQRASSRTDYRLQEDCGRREQEEVHDHHAARRHAFHRAAPSPAGLHIGNSSLVINMDDSGIRKKSTFCFEAALAFRGSSI